MTLWSICGRFMALASMIRFDFIVMVTCFICGLQLAMATCNYFLVNKETLVVKYVSEYCLAGCLHYIHAC
jgi:hypothetical protein